MEEIRNTLSKANAERARINKEYKKRKFWIETRTATKKKFKKNDKKKEEQ